jgi:polar amino acid transport system substrate-binding protein
MNIRIAACLLIFSIAFVIGCGGNKGGASTGSTPKDGAAGGDTLAAVKKAGTVKWGCDPSGGAPFVYTDPDDAKGEKIIGFEMDIMDKLAANMGVKHEIVRAQWDGLLENMISLRSDIVVNGYEINEERLKKVDFSEPYYVYEQQLTVRAEDKDKYKKLDDLKGKRIATLSGAEANNVLKAAGWKDDDIKPAQDSQSPYEDLKLKRVDAVLQESIIAAHYAGKDKDLFNVPDTFSSGKYGIAVRKGDKALLAEVNRALGEMKKNGDLAAIYTKWNIMTDKQKEIGIQSK